MVPDPLAVGIWMPQACVGQHLCKARALMGLTTRFVSCFLGSRVFFSHVGMCFCLAYSERSSQVSDALDFDADRGIFVRAAPHDDPFGQSLNRCHSINR